MLYVTVSLTAMVVLAFLLVLVYTLIRDDALHPITRMEGWKPAGDDLLGNLGDFEGIIHQCHIQLNRHPSRCAFFGFTPARYENALASAVQRTIEDCRSRILSGGDPKVFVERLLYLMNSYPPALSHGGIFPNYHIDDWGQWIVDGFAHSYAPDKCPRILSAIKEFTERFDLIFQRGSTLRQFDAVRLARVGHDKLFALMHEISLVDERWQQLIRQGPDTDSALQNTVPEETEGDIAD